MGPYTKYFVIYSDFPLNNHLAKTCCCIRVITALWYPSRDTLEFDQGHVTKNQPISVLVLSSEILRMSQYQMIPHWDITVISTPAEYLICVIRVQWKEIICVVVVSCSVNFWASEKDDSLKGGVWVETDNPFAYFFLLLFCFCSLFPTNPRVDTERRKSNKRISGGTDPSKYQVMYVNYPTHLKWTAIVVLTKFLFYRETTTLN